jgi:Na+/melibiose symporter-like transporter
MRELRSNAGAWAKVFSPADYIKITVLGFATTALWQSLHTIILPLRLLDFVAESQKNTYLGLLTFAGLILAMLIQPIAGLISDRSGFSWGRRRPYILVGTMLAILFLPGIGLAGSFIVLFTAYCLLQISSNIAQGPYQGLIPDLVPEGKRGRASGIKSMLELIGGAIALLIIGIFMALYAAGEGSGWLWLVLAILGTVLLVAMVATVLTVKERPGIAAPRLPILPTIYQTFKIDLKANHNFIWFLASRLLVFMAFATVQQFTLYFLKDVVDIADPAEATSRFFVIAVIGMLAVVYPAGRLSDKIGRKPIAISSGLLGAVAIAIVFFSHNYISILIAGGVMGIAIGAFMSTNWALAIDLVAKGEEARYLGLANMATAGGAALARLIGPVIDFFNVQSAGLGYQVMLAACFVYFVAGALLLLKIKDQHNRRSAVQHPTPTQQPTSR